MIAFVTPKRRCCHSNLNDSHKIVDRRQNLFLLAWRDKLAGLRTSGLRSIQEERRFKGWQPARQYGRAQAVRATAIMSAQKMQTLSLGSVVGSEQILTD